MKQKNILKIVMILMIVCILIIAIIFKLLNEENSNIDTSEDSPSLDINKDLTELKAESMLFTIENIIENSIEKIGKFYAEKVYYKEMEFDVETQVYIYGTIWSNDFSTKESAYICINLQQEQLLYNMEVKQKGLTKIEFEEVVKAISETTENIKYNSNDTFEYIPVSEEQMVRRYMDYYATLALYSPSDAYELLDEEYKQKRFGNLEAYLQYLDDVKYNLQMLTLQKYGVNGQSAYVDYIAVDTNNNYYTITQTGLFDIKIKLDNYTIENAEYVTKYNTLTEEEKVKVCVTKFIKMINAKDYANLYNFVNETFRINNFGNIDIFKKYINNRFFDYNILDKTEIKAEANAYICKLTISSGSGSASEQKSTNIIIEIKENTDFEISFVK